MLRTNAVPFWRDIRVLTLLGQVVFVLLVAAGAGFLYANLSTAMRQRGLVAGFEFLGLESGFEIGEGLVSYRPSDTYGRAFLVGLLNTLLVSVAGIALSTLLGILVGVARISSNWLVAKAAAAYVEIIRNTPLLVQLVLLYFGVFVNLPPVSESLEMAGAVFANQRGIFVPRPMAGESLGLWGAGLALAAVVGVLVSRWISRRTPTPRAGVPALTGLLAFFGIGAAAWFLVGSSPILLEIPEKGRFNFSGGLALSPEFSAILVGLVLYTAGFIAEVVRGGLQAVKRGQIEAARALGLEELRILQLIIFPQAMRVIIPPLTSQYLNLAKNSSLAIAIGYPDVFSVSSTIANQTGQPVPVIALVMATYLVMSLFTSLLMNIYNQRVQVLEK